jgi:hypothetical protein
MTKLIACGLVVAALLSACSGDADRSGQDTGSTRAITAAAPTMEPSTSEPTSSVPTPNRPSARQVRAALNALPGGWSPLEFPRRHRASAVYLWTGRELFFWGGDTDNNAVHHADGIAYDPVSDRWRQISDAPIPGRSQAGAVRTGREAVVWGRTSGRAERVHADGAAFDPASRTWRALSESPLTPRIPLATVWTGTEMLVWGNREWNSARVDGAAYDPERDTWRRLPDSPLTMNRGNAIWTGSEMVVLGAFVGDSRFDRYAKAMAYDPRADSWRVLRPYPFAGAASTLVWTGQEILAWDYEFRAAAYEPRDAWRAVPGPPLDFYECGPSGVLVRRAVLAFSCGLTAICDSRGWHPVPRPARVVWSPPIVAGPVVFVLGTRLWAYSVD